MKKSKIWIRVCVHLLLFITLGVHSSEFVVNPVTDDISRLWPLRQNIPKDYKIPVHYIPKEEAGMCWVKLNVFYLEESLKDLAHKFGNISSNRKDISIFIQMLQELRLKMESVEPIMYDFECHYRKERWPTARYFDFVEDFLIAAPPQYRQDSDECDPPPCPTTTTYTSSTTTTKTTTTTTTQYLPDSSAESPLPSGTTADCDSASTDCKSWNEQQRFLPEAVERSLLLLLVIPVAAVVFLLVWKVRSRRNRDDPEQNSGEGGLFAGSEVTAPSLTVEITEKRPLLSSGLCPKFPTEIELNTKMYFVVIPETPLRILSSDCSPKLALPLHRDSSG